MSMSTSRYEINNYNAAFRKAIEYELNKVKKQMVSEAEDWVRGQLLVAANTVGFRILEEMDDYSNSIRHTVEVVIHDQTEDSS